VNQVVQGSPEALGPKWLTGNRHRPLAWCGVARTVCAGDVETRFVSGEAPQWRQHQGDQGSLASA
jgi:hypothetical protein